jgi:hypothetical protein
MKAKSPSVFFLCPQPGGGGGVSNPVDVNPNPATSSSNSVFSGDESSSSAFDMELLKAGLATVSTISLDHANLKGRVSQLEGKFEHWEEVLNHLLQSGGIHFSHKVTAGSIHPITPLKPENQD